MSLKEALDQFANGKFVIITDDADRENEGDLMLLAETATTEALGFMVRHSSGVICAALTADIAQELKLPAMVKNNQDEKRTAFTVSVDAVAGLTTGISAHERANTLRELARADAKPSDFNRPGHIFPLIADVDGLAARRGHTEAGVVMAQLVGARPVTAIGEIVNDDGSLANGAQLQALAEQFNIPIFSIQELADYAAAHLQVTTSKKPEYRWAKLPRESGDWQIAVHLAAGGVEHAILRFGNPAEKTTIRLHSECLTGDALGSRRCDCGDQLASAFSEIESAGNGYIIYLRDHEGRGIGLGEKIEAYLLQDQGLDTVDANIELGHAPDERDWRDAVEIIHRLGVSHLSLLTNNPSKGQALSDAGISFEIKPLQPQINATNRDYLTTKKNRMFHNLEIN